jgi:hypothetical protein
MSAGRGPAHFVRQTITYTLFAIIIECTLMVLLFPVAGVWAFPLAGVASLGALVVWIAIRGLAWQQVRTPMSGPFVHLTPTTNLPTITAPNGMVHLRTTRSRSRPLMWPPNHRPTSLLFLFVSMPTAKRVGNNFTSDQVQSGVTAIVIEQLPADARVFRRRADNAVAIDVDYIGPGATTQYRSERQRHAGERFAVPVVGLRVIDELDRSDRWASVEQRPGQKCIACALRDPTRFIRRPCGEPSGEVGDEMGA